MTEKHGFHIFSFCFAKKIWEVCYYIRLSSYPNSFSSNSDLLQQRKTSQSMILAPLCFGMLRGMTSCDSIPKKTWLWFWCICLVTLTTAHKKRWKDEEKNCKMVEKSLESNKETQDWENSWERISLGKIKEEILWGKHLFIPIFICFFLLLCWCLTVSVEIRGAAPQGGVAYKHQKKKKKRLGLFPFCL